MQFTDSNGNLLVAADEMGGTLSGSQRLAALDTVVDADDIPRQIAAGMTDDELEQAGDEAINDAIGELTNMTVGTFKNQLCDRGYHCKLTIPSILRGSNFSIEPTSSVTRRTYRFEVGSHRIVTDLLMKIDC